MDELGSTSEPGSCGCGLMDDLRPDVDRDVARRSVTASSACAEDV